MRGCSATSQGIGNKMKDLDTWLAELGLEKYCQVFAENDIELGVLPDLTDGDLANLGLSLGHRRKLMAAAARLRPRGGVFNSPATGAEDALQQVERRQVTVLFTDLVGSTALSTELDPEDLSALLREFQDRCARAIARHEGFLARYLGDGVLAYFGFPAAHEHDAERAVRAGLDILREVAQIKVPGRKPLETRVGIATGLVVVGEIIGEGASQEHSIVGETPNLAARLQALAEPGWVVIGAATERLAGRFFEHTYLGEHVLKGFAQPVPAWRTLREQTVQSRFAAIRSSDGGPLVGRDRELGFAMEYWAAARNGEGHAILLCGDAGMGKSRLLEAITEGVTCTPHRMLRCQCSPYHRTSALYPVIQLLRSAADIHQERDAVENLAALRIFLDERGLAGRQALLLLAEALGIEMSERISPMELTKAQRKAETLALLSAFLEGGAGDPTTLLLLEDAHWIDPTTQELIDRLLQNIDRQRLLAVITHRPDFKTSWSELPQATTIACKKLSRENCAAMVRHLAREGPMADAVIEEIFRRSDGVPLFVEELTKAVVEAKAVRSASVPATLQDSLMSRLDRLGRAKDVAQVASVIGRQFQHSLLAEIVGVTDAELAGALQRLLESGLVFRVAADIGDAYLFNHSLVQEAAYESLLKTRRQALHEKIARILEQKFEVSRDGEPDLIAHHFSRAGLHAEACTHWRAAADHAAERSAFAEAIASLGHALDDANLIAGDAQRNQARLDVLLKLGTTYIIQQGPPSKNVETTMTEARTLALQGGPSVQLFQSTWGLYLNAATTRRFEIARQHVSELVSIGEQLKGDDIAIESLHHQWGISFFTGQTRALLKYAEEGARRYVPERHHRAAHVFAGHDFGVCALCNVGNALSLLGELDSVQARLEDSVRLAESLNHPQSIQFALGNCAFASYACGHYRECGEYAQRQLEIATRYDFPLAIKTAHFFLAVSAVHHDPVDPSLRILEENAEPALKAGFFGLAPGAAFADALGKAGRSREGLAFVDKFLDSTLDPEVGAFISELWRLRGEFTLSESRDDKALGERYLRTAVSIAGTQEAALLRMRAALALARLLADGGSRDEARSILTAAENGLTPACECPELPAARNLLRELA
jgi:predicted ATPase/class 3 adenylate cyclase